MKPKKKKPNLKKKANAAFSLFIRTRDALKTTGDPDYALCITCDRRYPTRAVGGLQAGHFVAGRHNAVLYDERNCHAQCYGCNVGKKGNMVSYYEKMQQMYGQEVIEELKELDKQTRQYKPFELQELIDTYQEKYLNLLSDKKLPF